ncbi:MAG: hypothetical protein ABIQ13_06845, partial [Pedococcus sp.]
TRPASEHDVLIAQDAGVAKARRIMAQLLRAEQDIADGADATRPAARPAARRTPASETHAEPSAEPSGDPAAATATATAR